MRYHINNRKITVLMDIALAGTTEGHYPEEYEVWIDLKEHARWGSVRCSCGNEHREAWQPETESYLDMLCTAWLALPCYVIPITVTEEHEPPVVEVILTVDRPIEVQREGNTLRIYAPPGVPEETRVFLLENLTREEHNRMRAHVGLPSVEEAPYPDYATVDLSKVKFAHDCLKDAV